MNEWNIQSRAHACQICESPFEDKQACHTVLFEENRDLMRLDLCAPCWKADLRDERVPRKGIISSWQGVYEAPPAAPPEAIQKENAESLLRRLIELNDPQYLAAVFILAVMLERKRLLKVKEQFHHEGRRMFIYEQPATGDVFTVADPSLQLSQLEEVQRQVAHLLEFGLAAPAPAEIALEPASPQETPAEPAAASDSSRL